MLKRDKVICMIPLHQQLSNKCVKGKKEKQKERTMSTTEGSGDRTVGSVRCN